MFRGMRRFKQLMSEEEVKDMLTRKNTGILAVQGEEGYPYTIPMNYVYYEGNIYFHGALEGHKVDAIRKNNKVSFCVVDEDTPVPEKFTTIYSSVVVFGQIVLIEDEERKTRIMQALDHKYSPGFEEKGNLEIAKAMKRLAVLELQIVHMTGKASMELINQKK